MLPTPGDRHVNRPLTDMSISYRQDADAFVTAANTPRIMSDHKSDDFYRYTKADTHRIEVKQRAPGTPAAVVGFRITTSTFTTKKYSIGKMIYDDELENFDDPQDPTTEATETVTDQMMMHEEKNWADTVFATGLWDIDLDGVAAAPGALQFLQWDQAGSTPVEDLRGQKRTILQNTGKSPNSLYLGNEVFDVLVDHAEIIDRLGGLGEQRKNSATPVTRSALAALLELDRVVVSKAVYNTAGEGLTAVNAFILGKHALLAYVNMDRPRIRQPSAFYTFAWRGFFGAPLGYRIKSFRMEDNDSTKVVADTAFVHELTGVDLAAFFEDAVG